MTGVIILLTTYTSACPAGKFVLRFYRTFNTIKVMLSMVSGLHGVIHKLWSWCQIDTALMTYIVSLLTTFTSSCPIGKIICLMFYSQVNT